MIKYYEFKAIPIDGAKYGNTTVSEGKFACEAIGDTEAYLRETLDKLGLRLELIRLDHELLIEPLQEKRPEILRSLRQKGHWLTFEVGENDSGS